MSWVDSVLKLAGLPSSVTIAFFVNNARAPGPIGAFREVFPSEYDVRQAQSGQGWAQLFAVTQGFDAGCRLFAVEADGVPVSFGWAKHSTTFDVAELAGSVELVEPIVWIFACCTHPEHRGKGHYSALLVAIRREFDDPATVVFADCTNKASIRGIVKAGFEPAYTIKRGLLWYTVKTSQASQRLRFRANRPRWRVAAASGFARIKGLIRI